MRFGRLLIALAANFLLLGQAVLAQAIATPQTSDIGSKTFVELSEIRQSLEKEIPPLQQEVVALTAKISERESLEHEADYLKRAYQNASPGTNPHLRKSFKDQAIAAQARLDNAAAMEAKDKLVQDLQDKQVALANKNQEKDRVEQRMSELIDIERPRQAFKKTMSIYFTLLVGLVIAGFFSIAWYDVQVRRSIFSSESGIQFITLFALVISIILFGITGILEDKELSALLGGLSGYILGRSTTKKTAGQDSGATPTEPVPAVPPAE